MKTLSSGSRQPALICWFCLKYNLKFSGVFCYNVNGSPPGKYFWLQPHPHNPVQRDMWCVEKSLHLLPQKPLQRKKQCHLYQRKKSDLQRCHWQSCDNFSCCWRHYFEPHCVHFSDRVWRNCQNCGRGSARWQKNRKSQLHTCGV